MAWVRDCACVSALLVSGCLDTFGIDRDPTLPAATDSTTDPPTTSQPTTGEPPSSSETTFPPGVCEDDDAAECYDGNDIDADACLNNCKRATCGDGVVWLGEEACDDGPANAADAACLDTCDQNTCGDGFLWTGHETCDDGNLVDGDACTNACTPAVCGDGVVRLDLEQCDDGPDNGDAYGGCTPTCELGPRCGDGLVNGPELCDDHNEVLTDGCAACVQPASCLHLLMVAPTAPTDTYRVWPAALGGATDVPVHCDMKTDGGGYTFLKIDVDSDMNDLPYLAPNAEATCAEYGMRLWIPRSPAHLLSGYAVATTENIPPLGGGDNPAGSDYLRILGIYPVTPDLSCPGAPLTPADCPEWSASDGNAWYITDVSTSTLEPDPDGACDQCSMSYVWNGDGTVKSYKAVPNGASSFRFLCDTADKLP